MQISARSGPFPDLYDPLWFPEKLLSAFAEGAASLAALSAVLLCRRREERS
jgi:hypothetical protein